ncbi:MAG: ABC transporter ATP-binding protein, partial [Blautia sp.]|nr:ABC transporter ATP-binding protein [Blautia sp.]
MMRDTSTVTAGVVEIIPSLLCLATQFTGAFFILLKLDYVLVLVIVILGMLAAFLVFFLGNKTKRFHKEAREKEDQIESTTQEMLRNLRVVKAAGIEHKALSAVRQRQTAYFGIQSLRNRYVKRTNVVVTGVFMVSEGFAVIWGCIRIYTGAMSYGTMAALLGLVGQIQGPISGLSHYIAQAYAAISSAERLDEILALPEDEIPAVNAEERAQYQQMQEAQTTDLYARLLEIDIDHISFTYGRDTIFRDASLKLYPGEIMAITGHSGIGKSTFFLLLLGLYLPGEGNIRFAINEYHTGSRKGIVYYEPTQMRRLFSYVPQGNALFSGTIRENISMFRELVTEEEIMRAAKQACIDEFILSLEDGLDTVIGENGLGLSEGQAQRIAIARAFLSNAPILLLDEATSALDDDTECKVLQSIAKMKNKTCLIVTHRMKALEICHRRCQIVDQKLEVL